MTSRDHILIGSTFPLSLIRRRVVIEPRVLDELRERLCGAQVSSFWGHTNTLTAAAVLLGGVDLAPESNRPAVVLDGDGFPVLGGRQFDECWVLSPDYTPGFRPAIGEVVPTDKIAGWQVLRLAWGTQGDGVTKERSCSNVLVL